MQVTRPIQRRDERLLAAVRMAGVTVDDLARELGWQLRVLRQRLCVLRTRGVGAASGLWYPERAGRPISVVTHVSLRTLDVQAVGRFEAWCVADDRVCRADLVTGRCDYILWSWHEDLRIAERWSQGIALREEVKICVSRPIRIHFGHMLAGAPIFSRAQQVDPTDAGGLAWCDHP